MRILCDRRSGPQNYVSLMLSSEHRLISGNRVILLCSKRFIKSFQNGLAFEKAQLRRW